MIPRYLLGLLASFVVIGGCGPQGGTDVGNGRTIGLRLEGHEAAPPDGTRSRRLSSGVLLDEVWLAIDRIRLEPLSSCDSPSGEIDLDGPIVAELIAGTQLGASSFLSFEERYCRLRVGFHDLDLAKAPAGTPAALDDLSLLVVGARADGVPFVVRSDLRERLDLRAIGGEFVLNRDLESLLVAFELGSWIAALDLDALAGPSIVIDADQNGDRLDAFEEAVKASVALYDDDDDGKLGPGDILLAD